MLKTIVETYNCLDDFNTSLQRRKDVIRKGITDSISIMENHFGITLEKTITEDESSIIFKGITSYGTRQEYIFTVSKWFDSELVFNTLSFGCASSLMISNGVKNIFTLSLNKDFTLQSLKYVASFKDKNGNEGAIELLFNNEFVLVGLSVKVYRINSRDDYLINITKKRDMLSSFDDEVFLLQVELNKNDTIEALLPEFYTPSAYDFNSVEFIDRLEVYRMLTF